MEQSRKILKFITSTVVVTLLVGIHLIVVGQGAGNQRCWMI
jgi:hypothetical protein